MIKNYSNLAPVCLFCYNRPDLLDLTLKSLAKNFLAKESILYVFSDGPKCKKDKLAVDAVRARLKAEKDSFKKIIISKSKHNKGLANSVIDGVTQVIEEYGSVIVLEDDLLTARNFLDFMNQALLEYESFGKMFSVSGFTLDLPELRQRVGDYYLGYRSSSWGWATWQNRWTKTNWDLTNFTGLSMREKRAFRRGGSDLPKMLNNQLSSRIDSWAIRWVYQQFTQEGLTLFPKISKVISIGIGDDATHTKKTTRFETVLDAAEKRSFLFDETPVIDPALVRAFRKKFSIWSRMKDRL